MDAETKKIRYSREVESLLKQFQKWGEGGVQAGDASYRRRYAFAFELDEKTKAAIVKRMESGASFEEAFDAEREGGQ